MEVKNINKYFSYDILRRGYDYYKKGKVKSIIKLKDGYIARVNGTKEYNVTILIDKTKKNIINLECTCPYAEESNCKHMAAVLYCLKNNDLPTTTNIKKTLSKELTDFEKFKKDYKRECHKLFHGRYYLHQNELDDYSDIVNHFIKEGTKYIKDNIALAYQIFEYFIMEIDEIDVYDEFNKISYFVTPTVLSYEYSDKVEYGHVISTDPEKGTTINPIQLPTHRQKSNHSTINIAHLIERSLRERSFLFFVSSAEDAPLSFFSLFINGIFIVGYFFLLNMSSMVSIPLCS